VQQRLRDAEALLHPVTESANAALGAVPEARDLKHLVDALLAYRARHAAHEPQVAASAHQRVEGGVVDEAADVTERPAQVARYAVTTDLDPAVSRTYESENHADDRGLACAVGPEEAEDVSSADLYVEAVNGAQGTKLLREPARHKHRSAVRAALLLRPRSDLRRRLRRLGRGHQPPSADGSDKRL
jgi:hypothetical protein